MTKGQTAQQTELVTPRKSSVKKYQQFVIGNNSIAKLLKYELIFSPLNVLPGAIGFFLRKKFYPSIIRKVGRNVTFGKNIILRHPHRIQIGDNVIIDDNCVLDARGNTGRGIIIGDNVILGRNTMLSMKDGTIQLGENTNIGVNCALQTTTNISIGRNCIIAAYANIVAGGNHRYDDLNKPIISQGMIQKGGIVIEENVWIGARVTVMDGVKISEGSVIGACALVNNDIPPFSIAYGIPARVVKSRKNSR